MIYNDIVLRHKYLQFIQIGDMEEFSIFGAGSEDLTTDYEAEEFEFKPVTSKSGFSTTTGYTLSTSVEEVIFADNPVFEAVDKLRRKHAIGTEAKGQIVDVFLYNEEEDMPTEAPADQYDVSIVFTGYGGPSSDPISISYEIRYQGTPVEGTATIDYDAKTATFVETVTP